MARIIAEIASCHNGDLELAKALIVSASKNGADLVKFQDWRAGNVPEGDPDKKRYELYQFKDEWYDILIPFCAENGVEFLTTCFNADRAEYLASKGLKRIKLASISLTNTDLLMAAGANFEEVILSTAMHSKEEIEAAIDQLETSAKKYTIMHCVANYPLEYENANLARIYELNDMVGDHGAVGYSDHALGVEAASMAIAMGVHYIEKHFTLSRDLPQISHQMYNGGPLVTTHVVSIEPNQLSKIAEWRDKVAVMRGTGGFSVNDIEKGIRERYQARYGK